jgi:predicted nucleic acid-binding protein
MSGERAFFDTNALVYLYSDDEPTKQGQALLALLTYECIVSRQVMNEFCNVCIKKQKLPVERLKQVIANIRYLYGFYEIQDETVLHAIAIHERFQFSYYDSLIVASALESGCGYLFTEDLQDGQMIDGLTIRNIFAGDLLLHLSSHRSIHLTTPPPPPPP